MVEGFEIRLHGRGGQGGVTCAKILAAAYAKLGYDVQTFGDYAGERSGAPVRAYTRVSKSRITNRNKVYRPDHIVVLDPHLLGPDTLAGLAPRGSVLVNSPETAAEVRRRVPGFRLGVVDATAIARRHGIGTRSVVIVNTTIAGAFAKLHELPFQILAETYEDLGFTSNLEAAREAFEAVTVLPAEGHIDAAPRQSAGGRDSVVALPAHRESPPTPLKTGSWRTQRPVYVVRPAPCNAACPAGNDVVGFVQALARGEVAEAARILAATTPFPAVCGRVCPAPCMRACNRGGLDGPVGVRALERWVGDHATPEFERARPRPRRRLAVVGGGPAGLGAAWTAARRGHEVTVFERGEHLGGVLRTGIPEYRLPRDVLDREVARILAAGVRAETGRRLGPGDLPGLTDAFDAVILATGLQRLREPEIPGRALEGVEQGIAFLERVNAGAARIQGRVVVLGGGNTAMDCARSALRAGACEVVVAYRRTRAEMPAIAEEIDEALDEGVRLLELRAPAAFLGRAKLRAVRLEVQELGAPGDDGRRRPVGTGRHEELPCEFALLALGQTADERILPAGWRRAGLRIETPAGAPVFAAGDFATADGTVTHAIGAGRRAVLAALAALDGHRAPAEPRAAPVGLTDLHLHHFPRRPPARERLLPPGERRRSQLEVRRGLDDPSEAARCFSCGHCTRCDTCLLYCPEGIIDRRGDGYLIDEEYCKGCGICAAECPRSAMEMVS